MTLLRVCVYVCFTNIYQIEYLRNAIVTDYNVITIIYVFVHCLWGNAIRSMCHLKIHKRRAFPLRRWI